MSDYQISPRYEHVHGCNRIFHNTCFIILYNTKRKLQITSQRKDISYEFATIPTISSLHLYDLGTARIAATARHLSTIVPGRSRPSYTPPQSM